MAHSQLAASGEMNGKGNLRNTKNLTASGRLRAIFEDRWAQLFMRLSKYLLIIILILKI